MPPSIRRNELDVPAMTNDKLNNFDTHVKNFIHFLNIRLDGSRLVYDGPSNIANHIYDRTVYACSVKIGAKLLKDVFPVMIGSKLDKAIRFDGKRCDFYSSSLEKYPFTSLDIGLGNFIINGSLRQVPNFFTTDSTNTYVFQQIMMRVHSYDELDRGKQLNWYFQDEKLIYPQGLKKFTKNKETLRKLGDVVIIHNDGHETLETQNTIEGFFSHCPFPVSQTPYNQKILPFFDIDDLSNLMIVTPGNLFMRLFVKHLYGPLREGKNSLIKSKHALIVKSIETGNLLHGLSQKTLFFKETRSCGKATDMPMETTYREVSDDGKVFKEKYIGCYREVPIQTYPLIPYLMQMMVRQTSFKVKHNSLTAFHPSYLGFMCVLGCFETKNVGRTLMTARGTIVSTKGFEAVLRDGKKSSLWKLVEPSETENFFIVVNEACVRITEQCFERIDLLRIKRKYKEIECFKKQNFIFIRYKSGLLMKRLGDTGLLVTSKDEMYWACQMFPDDVKTKTDLVRKLGFDYVTGYHVDLNPYFMHNAAPKTILGFNALKGAVLATNSKYVRFFMDSLSAYIDPKAVHYYKDVLPPKNDGISDKFVLKVPRIVVAYMSFLGLTQDDCIVRRKDMNAFDCIRFYTLRIKVVAPEPDRLVFNPVKGHSDKDDKMVGIAVYHGKDKKNFLLESFSLHAEIKQIASNVYQIHFSKAPFRVVQYYVSKNVLSVSVEQLHVSGTGDKLSTFHGQKGVMRVWEDVPLLDKKIKPDLIVNTSCLFRMTAGQIKEGLEDGRDAISVQNTRGRFIPNSRVFYGKTFYFPIAYWGTEHMYAPESCRRDKILNQATKGRSRNGGMRIGNMEVFNGMRGNGIASCFEEKFFKHGDSTGLSYIPKSVNLVVEDAKFFKYDISFTEEPSVKRIKRM